jgi:hypothetical protein
VPLTLTDTDNRQAHFKNASNKPYGPKSGVDSLAAMNAKNGGGYWYQNNNDDAPPMHEGPSAYRPQHKLPAAQPVPVHETSKQNGNHVEMPREPQQQQKLTHDEFRSALQMVVMPGDPRSHLSDAAKIGEGSTGIVITARDATRNGQVRK